MKTGWVRVGAMALLLMGCGRTSEFELTSNEGFRVQKGQPLALQDFPAVVAVGGCSGSLIQRDWVITASHCTEWAGTNASAITVDVLGESYRVQRLEYPPRPGDKRHMGNDFALLQLERPVPNVAPMPLFEGRFRVGEVTTIVGFGENENAERGKRRGSMAAARSQYDYGSTNGVRNTLEFTVTADDQSACGGDSGGAVIRWVSGAPRLAGVMVAAGFDTAGKCGTSRSMIAVNMAAWAPFIDSVVGGVRVPLGPAPVCALQVSPAVLTLPGTEPGWFSVTLSVSRPADSLDFGIPQIAGNYLYGNPARVLLHPGRHLARYEVISQNEGTVGACEAAVEVRAGAPSPTPTPTRPFVPTHTQSPPPTRTPNPSPTHTQAPLPTPTRPPTAIPTPPPAPTPTVNPGSQVTLQPPQELRTVKAGPYQAILAWKDLSHNEVTYRVWRAEGKNPWTIVATLGPNAASFHDTKLRPNVRYQYRIRVLGPAGDFRDSTVLVLPAARATRR